MSRHNFSSKYQFKNVEVKCFKFFVEITLALSNLLKIKERFYSTCKWLFKLFNGWKMAKIYFYSHLYAGRPINGHNQSTYCRAKMPTISKVGRKLYRNKVGCVFDGLVVCILVRCRVRKKTIFFSYIIIINRIWLKVQLYRDDQKPRRPTASGFLSAGWTDSSVLEPSTFNLAWN